MRVMLDREMVLRRARVFAPLPVELSHQPSTFNHQPILAVGAHLKTPLRWPWANRFSLSQHIGDLETEPANQTFRRVANERRSFTACSLKSSPPICTPITLDAVGCGTRSAGIPCGCGRHPCRPFFHGARMPATLQAGSLRYLRVQHHRPRPGLPIAENEVELPALGVAWDGTGLGTDGTISGVASSSA